MAANFQHLQQAVADAVAEVQRTKGVQQSAIALINGFAAIVTQKVTEALEADNAADQGSIDAAVSAIDAARSEMTASTTELGNAVTANS